GLQPARPVAGDVGEAHQQWQLRAIRARLVDDFRQRHLRALPTARPGDDPALGVDVEITLAPVWDRIGLAGLINRPVGHRAATRGGGRAFYRPGRQVAVTGHPRLTACCPGGWLQFAPPPTCHALAEPAVAANTGRTGMNTETTWHYENFDPS